MVEFLGLVIKVLQGLTGVFPVEHAFVSGLKVIHFQLLGVAFEGLLEFAVVHQPTWLVCVEHFHQLLCSELARRFELLFLLDLSRIVIAAI